MKLTAFLITVGIIVAAIYDLIACQVGGIDYSISRWLQDTGFNAPFLVFTVGYICGHVWSYMPIKRYLLKVRIQKAGELSIKTRMVESNSQTDQSPTSWKLRCSLGLSTDDTIISVENVEYTVV